MIREKKLKTPLSKDDVLKLELGDIVYLNGYLFTGTDLFHIRTFQEGVTPPIDFKEFNVMLDTAPLMKKISNQWKAQAVVPTTTIRFKKWVPEVIRRFGLRAIIGKGGLPDLAKVLREYGCVYLAGAGNWSGALYASRIRRIKEVHWMDLGVPDALWVFEVENFGPTIVETDAKGNSIYARLEKEFDKRLSKVKKKLNINSFEYTN